MSFFIVHTKAVAPPGVGKGSTAEKTAKPYDATQGKSVIRSLKAIKKTYLGAEFTHALPGTFAGFR